MKKLLAFMGIFCLIVPLVFLGCEGDDGAAGTDGSEGPQGPPGITGKVEQCVVCHSKTGDELQASYDELYQDNVIQVANLNYVHSAVDNTDTVTFNMTKDGAGFDCTKVENLNIFFVPYTGTKFQFEPAAERLSIKGKLTSGAAGLCTSTLDNVVVNLNDNNGLVIVYGYDELVARLQPSRVRQVKYPYAALFETGPDGVDYVSAANNDGCSKCHTDPYLKHGNIYAQVDRDPATDFYTCKACHLDNGEGGHLEWKLLVNDPPLWAAYAGGADLTPEQEEEYAYNTSLMNDVHMSHAMEFPYPQSMANCATCHEGKLDLIFTDNNFVVETCKSCHPVTGSELYSGGIAGNIPYRLAPPYDNNGTPATSTLALETIVPHTLDGRDNCYGCHAGGFSAVTGHTGYDKVIYTDNGVKYSSNIKVTIDNASFADNTNLLTFAFRATGNVGTLNAQDIVPTVLVGLYGWDTKDFIVSPHGRDADRNRYLELKLDPADNTVQNHPRIKVISAGGGNWEVSADLSMWADLIAADNVSRVEIGVMPDLRDADDEMVALNAVSRTFDLGANDFDDEFYSPIVKVATGCNNCHDALATTFHSPDRGGSVVVCRLCHVTTNRGSHLEMQSRSIDSYVHAIHSFQAFDPGDIDFTDPVLALHYEDHTELFPYPTHGITNCESCHEKGAYNAPDQSKSLPGLLSGSDSLKGRVRTIGDVPEYVTGPGTRACGACHRSHAINEDSAGELEILFSHWRVNGYMEENLNGTLEAKIFEIMGLFP